MTTERHSSAWAHWWRYSSPAARRETAVRTPAAVHPAPTELRLAVGGESEDGYDPTVGLGPVRVAPVPVDAAPAGRRPRSRERPGHRLSGQRGRPASGRSTSAPTSTSPTARPVTSEDVAYTFTKASQSGGLTDVTVLDAATAVDRRHGRAEAEEAAEHVRQPARVARDRAQACARQGLRAQADRLRAVHSRTVGRGDSWLIVQRNERLLRDRKPAFERVVFTFTGEDSTLAAAKAGQVSMAAVPCGLARDHGQRG